jgi:hypothetical protein
VLVGGLGVAVAAGVEVGGTGVAAAADVGVGGITVGASAGGSDVAVADGAVDPAQPLASNPNHRIAITR